MDTATLARCPVAHDGAATAGAPAIDFFDATFKAGAHDAWKALRRAAPVHRTLFRDGHPLWLVTRHEDVLRVLKDPRFVKNRLNCLEPHEIAAPPVLLTAMRFVLNMLALDPPEHTRLRRLVMQAFSPRLVENLRPRIEAIADELLDAALPHGRIELIGEYAFPLPIIVIAELLGVPTRDRTKFGEWSNVLIANAGVRDAQAIGAMVPMLEAFAEYLRGLFEEKRKRPSDDLVTRLLQTGERDAALDEDEMISMMLLLIVAGHETTTHLIGNGMLALLRHPAQLARLAADPSLLPRAVDELLRYDGPVETSTLRYAKVDVELGGVRIPRGELVMAVITSANRDASQFDDPDRLDIARDARAHLAFGHGLHFCLGAALARAEAEVGIGALLRRLPRLRLAVDPSALRWRIGPLMRGLQTLPLAFEAGRI